MNSSEQVYRFDIVTDPDDPSVNDQLQELLLILTNENNVIETNLDRGLVNYVFNTNIDHNNKKIEELANIISYVPITVSLNLSLFDKYDNIAPVIKGAVEIIKVFTEKLIGTTVINVENIKYAGQSNNNPSDKNEDVIVFTPITNNNTAVYENPNYLDDYYRILNFDYIGGYQILSDDPIVRYVLNELYRSKDYIYEDIDVIYVEGVALIPVGTNDNEVSHYSDIKNRISTIVTTRRSQGYFSSTVGVHNLRDVKLAKELALLWNTKVVYEDVQNLVLKSDIDFGTSAELWYQNNIELIKNGQFPSITLYGIWQFQLGGDYNAVYGKEWYMVILQYAGLLAYKRLGKDDEFIRPFIHTVKVNNDYSVSVSLPSWYHSVKFKEYFENILSTYKDGNWYVEPCKDLLDGVVKRYYVQSIDNRSMPMVLTNVYENGKKDEVLIFRSPATNIYSIDFDFDTVNLDNIKTKLINDLKKHYNVCQNRYQLINNNEKIKENVDDMDLNELLNLVEIKEGTKENQDNKQLLITKGGNKERNIERNKIKETDLSYCYSKNTILNLKQPINPMTNKPFTEHIMLKAMLMEWGMRGLFDVGPIKGMYSDMPKRVLVPPTIGTPVYSENMDNIYTIDIKFGDGINETFAFLFDINIGVSEERELKNIVNTLWEKGFFLSYWNSALENYIGNNKKLTDYILINANRVLLNAEDSKEDGVRALNYMKEIYSQL